jgi:hypothetical protein
MSTLRFVELSLVQLAAEVPLSGCVVLGVLCSIVLVASARGGVDG